MVAAPGEEAELWSIVKPGLDKLYQASSSSLEETTGEKVREELGWKYSD